MSNFVEVYSKIGSEFYISKIIKPKLEFWLPNYSWEKKNLITQRLWDKYWEMAKGMDGTWEMPSIFPLTISLET